MVKQPESFLKGQVQLYAGDCLDVLKTLPENSIDSCVTDPPYGLGFMGKDWDTFARVRDYKSRGGYGDKGILPHYGRGGKSQDREHYRRKSNNKFQVWCVLWAEEVLRVLKPGGHLLAFGGTRTQHRMVCAIEDAGFEIRDSIYWHYGSGFPKSHSVNKTLEEKGLSCQCHKNMLSNHDDDEKNMRDLRQAMDAEKPISSGKKQHLRQDMLVGTDFSKQEGQNDAAGEAARSNNRMRGLQEGCLETGRLAEGRGEPGTGKITFPAEKGTA